MNKYIGEGGQLLLILEKLSEIVSDGLGVVVGSVPHPHSVIPLAQSVPHCSLCRSLLTPLSPTADCQCRVSACVTLSWRACPPGLTLTTSAKMGPGPPPSLLPRLANKNQTLSTLSTSNTGDYQTLACLLVEKVMQCVSVCEVCIIGTPCQGMGISPHL